MKEAQHDSFIAGRVAKVTVAGKEVAFLGEVHPQVLENWELTVPIAALELNCSALFELIQKKK